MKNRILILLLLLSVNLFGQSSRVPDTDNFSLQDVVNCISPISDDLDQCFTESVQGNFDLNYGNGKTPPNSLYEFRNYFPRLKPLIYFVWELNEAASLGYSPDNTSQGRNGTWQNGFFNHELPGKLYYSCGMSSTAKIRYSNSTRPPYGYTFALWFYPTLTTYDVYQSIFWIYSNLGIGGSSTLLEGLAMSRWSPTQYRLHMINGGGASLIAEDAYITYNTWNHIVFSRKSDGTLNIYVNGTLATTHPYTLPPISGTNGTTYTAGYEDAVTNKYNTAEGRYDNFCFWYERALDAQDVLELWNDGNGKTYSAWDQ